MGTVRSKRSLKGGPCEWFDNEESKTTFSSRWLTIKFLANIWLTDESKTISTECAERKLKCLGQTHSSSPREWSWCSECSDFSNRWWCSLKNLETLSSAEASVSEQQQKVIASRRGIGKNALTILLCILFIGDSFALRNLLVKCNIFSLRIFSSTGIGDRSPIPTKENAPGWIRTNHAGLRRAALYPYWATGA